MASSCLLLSLVVVSLLITLQPTIGSELLDNVCITSPEDFTSPSQYNTNLIALLKILANVPSTGYTINGTGFGKPDPQIARGLINCWAGVSDQDCKTCARESTKAARILCPDSQGAILWYDNCLLKYTPETDYLGFTDTTNKFWMRSNVVVTGDATKFNSRVTDLLKKLRKKASTIVHQDNKLFGEGKTKADSNTTVYARVECTEDVGAGSCGDCLDEIIGDFPVCCDGVKGGRYVTGSCMFRFEEYPF